MRKQLWLAIREWAYRRLCNPYEAKARELASNFCIGMGLPLPMACEEHKCTSSIMDVAP